ncbi:S1C family serine protease [Lignipirellula cremea]|uniref:Serine protease HhoB n=1 Tax=Lignipirellula cremea TaxID=2528010 RepID=A0A518DVP6_9BACT|nr:trypsin-like peptidase domain-containing protein [Lignipirellula cremea]QDU95912.1 Putative serine protease HhoB precursor [Lignipirellula cremea]
MQRRHSQNRRWAATTIIAIAAVTALGGGHVKGSELRNTPEVKAIKRAAPSVVNIHGRKSIPGDASYGQTETFRQVNGMGTGVVIDGRGYIVTNYHVIEGVSRIQVTFEDDSTVTAELVANDPSTDLAVIKINVDREMPVIAFGTSDDLMVGEKVIALGNAYGYNHTATEGIISQLHRTVQVSDEQTYEDLIQTDASINPGNSGGPLLNIDGEMVGINVAVRVGAQGIGFAIPVNQALDIAARLMSIEKIENLAHGVGGKTTTTPAGVQFLVQVVEAGSPAQQSGLQAGDVITAARGLKIGRPLDFERALLGAHLGEEIELQVKRKQQEIPLNLVIDRTQPAVGATVALRSSSNSNNDTRGWDILGLRLEAIPQRQFQNYGARYRGGLKVVEVRAESPAFQQGIRSGDVLVGMHIWETVTADNVDYILDRPEFDRLQPIKFYILRGGETLYGHMRVASVPRR